MSDGEPKVDGVLQLDATEKELVHESFVVDTRDHDDHTFCGIMFDCACETNYPAEYIELTALAVRGALGPMTVWKTDNSFFGKHETMSAWEQIYRAEHEPSKNEYTSLKLEKPIRLAPGESVGLYVHSALPGDEGIVYDNHRGYHVTYQDRVFKMLPGMAHLSNRPFGKRGFWGRPWRVNREFVGKAEYGVRWKMWSPSPVHLTFPLGFQKTFFTMLMASRRPESLMYLLQDEIVFFIMNKCSWDWWGTENPRYEESSGTEGEAGSSSNAGGGKYGALHHTTSELESLLHAGGYGGGHGSFFSSLMPDAAFAADSDSDSDEYYYEEEDDDEDEDEDESSEEEDDDDDEDEEEMAVCDGEEGHRTRKARGGGATSSAGASEVADAIGAVDVTDLD